MNFNGAVSSGQQNDCFNLLGFRSYKGSFFKERGLLVSAVVCRPATVIDIIQGGSEWVHINMNIKDK